MKGLEEYKPGEASQVMLDVLVLSNSSMVERRLGLIRLNGDACSKRADPFIFSFCQWIRSSRCGVAERSGGRGANKSYYARETEAK